MFGQVGLKEFDGLAVVVPVAVRRDEQGAVDEVEVHVRRRQPLAVVDDGAGHGDLDDLERAAVLVDKAIELSARGLQHLVIRVGRIVLDRDDDLSRADEPGKVVDVAVGVVAFDPAGEPGDVLLAVVVLQVLLDLLL